MVTYNYYHIFLSKWITVKISSLGQNKCLKYTVDFTSLSSQISLPSPAAFPALQGSSMSFPQPRLPLCHFFHLAVCSASLSTNSYVPKSGAISPPSSIAQISVPSAPAHFLYLCYKRFSRHMVIYSVPVCLPYSAGNSAGADGVLCMPVLLGSGKASEAEQAL